MRRAAGVAEQGLQEHAEGGVARLGEPVRAPGRQPPVLAAGVEGVRWCAYRHPGREVPLLRPGVRALRVHADRQIVHDPDRHARLPRGALRGGELGVGEPGEPASGSRRGPSTRPGRGRFPSSGGHAGPQASHASPGRAPRPARTRWRGPPAPRPARRGSRRTRPAAPVRAAPPAPAPALPASAPTRRPGRSTPPSPAPIPAAAPPAPAAPAPAPARPRTRTRGCPRPADAPGRGSDVRRAGRGTGLWVCRARPHAAG